MNGFATFFDILIFVADLFSMGSNLRKPKENKK